MDVVLAAAGAHWEAEVIGEIESSRSLRLVRRCVDVADLLTVAQTDVASAALVSTDLSGLDADTVYRLERAGVRVAAIEAEADRCGGLGIERQLSLGGLEAIALDLPVSTPDLDSPDAGRIVAVWGPAGAPGRSTVALGIAAAAAARGVDTVLVDADTYGGALAQMLAVLDDVSGLMAACRAANNGRPAEVADHLLAIDPGLRLLTGLPRADMWPQVRAGALDLVLRHLRATAELVVVDCGFAIEPGTGPGGASRNQSTLQVLELADEVVVVGRADPVGLARLVRGLHDLSEMLRETSPTIVVNMMRPSLGWQEREVESTLRRLTGMAPAIFLPSDQAGLDLASMSGRTARQVAPASPFVGRIEVLATALAPRGVVATSTP
jgi:MinD-like ATPase involved in chromosome partitioning or flagellar assembly